MKNYSKTMDNIRKHTARILSILMILSLLSGGIVLTGAGGEDAYTYAASQTQGDFEYTVSGGSATLTAYKGKATAPAIPSSIGGHKVTAIGPECFRGNAKITTIKVPEGITSIGDYAFEACSAATSVTLPASLKTIGKCAFSGDAQLKKIDIPKNVSKIGDGAFLYCMAVKDITGGEGLTELGQFVFAGCESLFSMDLSKSKLKALPDRTFCNCTRLFKVELPDSIETVGKRAFSNCDALGQLNFGPKVKSVGDYAFEKCSSLADLSFEGSEGLKLGIYEFYKSDGVQKVHLRLPNNTVITDETLAGAPLGGVYVSGDGYLKTASGKTRLIDNGQIYEDNGAVLIKAMPEKYENGSWVKVCDSVTYGDKSYTRYTVADSVSRIADGAFDGSSFDIVVLPAGIKTLDDKAFYGAEIQAMSMSGSNEKYAVVDGILYEVKEAGNGGLGVTSGTAGNAALTDSSSEADNTASSDEGSAASDDAAAPDTDNASATDDAGASSVESGSLDVTADTADNAVVTDSASDADSTAASGESSAASDDAAASDTDNSAATDEGSASSAESGNTEAGNSEAAANEEATGSEEIAANEEAAGSEETSANEETAGSGEASANKETAGSEDNENANSADADSADGNLQVAGASDAALAAAGDGTGKYRLLRFFRYRVDGTSLVRTTKDNPDAGTQGSGPGQQFVMPDNVVSIAPYAFSNAGVHVEIPDTSSLTAFEDNSFTNSGIRHPDDTDGYDFYGIVKIPSKYKRDTISISESAFDDYDTYYPMYDDDSESQDIDDLIRDDTDERDFNDHFARIDDDGDADDEDQWPVYDGDDPGERDSVLKITSESGSKSLYSDSKYGGFKVIPNSGFEEWSQKYLDYNKADIEFAAELMPYTMLYKGEAHYRSMVCVLNHDQYKTEFSIRNVGDDFAPMYLAMDHGLEAEIQRGRMPDDIVLYSGITTERMADIAGIKDKTVTPTKAQLINAIGREFTDPAFMSTTTNPSTAANFSSHSNTMIVIYASSEVLSKLGAVVIDSFSGWGAGEYEILFNLGAKFKVLDVGTIEVSGGGYDITETRTYIRLELMDPDEETPQDDPAPEEKKDKSPDVKPVVQPVPVVRTTAKSGSKMRVYWNKVSGAASYKLQYRKAGASKWKTVRLSKTSRVLKKMKNGGLYQYRVAAVDKNKKSGKYSEPSYRFYRKTKGVKYKAKKGAVKITWKKTKRASGYKILVADNKKMKNASVITIKGGKKKSAVVKGLKSGKRYYFSVRPYKDKGGNRYIGIRSKIKKVRVK